MTERDEELERGVALAKSALSAPAAVRARVRAKLAEAALAASAGRAIGGAGAVPSANGSRFSGVARSPSHAVGWAVAWIGLGLCAGYWLGFHRFGASLVEPTGGSLSEPAAGGAPGGSASSPSLRAPSAAGALETSEPDGDELPALRAASGPRENPGPTARDDDGDAAKMPGGGATASALGREGAREGWRKSSATRRAPLVGSDGADGVPSPAAAASSFAAEVALLERAERAIRAGEGALALTFLEELEQKFPASTLREERAAARVLAGCEQARSNGAAAREAARVAAERFLAQGSPLYADRVQELCDLGAGDVRSRIEDPREPGH